jgi:hypothetical protein
MTKKRDHLKCNSLSKKTSRSRFKKRDTLLKKLKEMLKKSRASSKSKSRSTMKM